METTTDRIMRAYTRTHSVTEDEATQVRAEVSRFVAELREANEAQLTLPTLTNSDGVGKEPL